MKDTYIICQTTLSDNFKELSPFEYIMHGKVYIISIGKFCTIILIMKAI